MGSDELLLEGDQLPDLRLRDLETLRDDLLGRRDGASAAEQRPRALGCLTLDHEDVDPRLRVPEIDLDRALVIGFLGGSGTGKSTLTQSLRSSWARNTSVLPSACGLAIDRVGSVCTGES